MLLMDTKNCLDVLKEWLTGAIDMHVHAALDCVSRKYTDTDLARQLKDCGNLHRNSIGAASLVRKSVR